MTQTLAGLALIIFCTTIDVIAGRPILDGRMLAIPAELITAVSGAWIVIVAGQTLFAFAGTVLAEIVRRAGVSIVALAGVVGIDAGVLASVGLTRARVRGAWILIVAVHLADRSAFPIDTGIGESAWIVVVARKPLFQRDWIVLALVDLAGVSRAGIVVVAVRRAGRNDHSVQGVDRTGVGRTHIVRIDSLGSINASGDRSVHTRGIDAGD